MQAWRTGAGIGTTRYEYDGLGRRIVEYNNKSLVRRHFYYDQVGRVVAEYVEQSGKRKLDREYIWDAGHAGRIACRIRHLSNGSEQRIYPLYDVQGNVVAIADENGDVQERYRYDVQGNVEFLNADFSRKMFQQSAFAWQHLHRGMRLDVDTNLHFAGGYYHSGLGRTLAAGAVGVLSEGVLNARADGFPLGTARPPGASQAARNLAAMAKGYEQLTQWVSEQAPWIKYTVGAGLLVGTAAVLAAYTISTGGANPHAWLAVGGAICGALSGGIESALTGGDYSDIVLAAGVGAVFGAICPFGAIGGFIVGTRFALTAWACGGDRNTIATAFQWGNLIGGLIGDYTGGALTAGKFYSMRALRAGLSEVGPDLLGAGVGAMGGAVMTGTATGALHGATMGMMAGGIGGGIARLRAFSGRANTSHNIPTGIAELDDPIGTSKSYAKMKADLEATGLYNIIENDANIKPSFNAQIDSVMNWGRFDIYVGPTKSRFIDFVHETGHVEAVREGAFVEAQKAGPYLSKFAKGRLEAEALKYELNYAREIGGDRLNPEYVAFVEGQIAEHVTEYDTALLGPAAHQLRQFDVWAKNHSLFHEY